MDDFVIRSNRLCRYFGRKCAVNGVSFDIPRGCVASLLGRNGSGKTTIIRMLLGLLEPSRGSSTVLGEPSSHLSCDVLSRVAYVAEGHPLPGWMTCAQLAKHQSHFYSTWDGNIYRSIIDHFQLDEQTRVSSLSRGQRAGVALAVALAPKPELLILDDPSLGLDPVARRGILEIIVDLCAGGGRTIFLSTHELQDVERVADRVLILDQSVLMADAEKDYFLSRVREYRIDLQGQRRPEVKGLVSAHMEGPMTRMIVANADEQTVRSFGSLKVEQGPTTLEDAVIAYLARRGHVLENAGGVA